MPALLYSFRRCPYAMRARMAVAYSGAQVETVEVSLKAKPPEMLERSPKGTVPVLVLDDQVLEQSLDIMRWALALNDPDDWAMAADPDAQRQVAELIAENDNRFNQNRSGSLQICSALSRVHSAGISGPWRGISTQARGAAE